MNRDFHANSRDILIRWVVTLPPSRQSCVVCMDVTMDYIREFDIRLEREMYYAGEVLAGHVLLDTVENFKLRCE